MRVGSPVVRLNCIFTPASKIYYCLLKILLLPCCACALSRLDSTLKIARLDFQQQQQQQCPKNQNQYFDRNTMVFLRSFLLLFGFGLVYSTMVASTRMVPRSLVGTGGSRGVLGGEKDLSYYFPTD